MSEMKHTPLPWEVCNGIDIYPVGDIAARHYVADCDPDGACLADMALDVGEHPHTDSTYEMKKANAEFIVRACNSHYDLLDAVQRAEAMIELMRSAAYQVGLEGTKEWDEIVGGSDVQGTYDVILKAIAKAMGRA